MNTTHLTIRLFKEDRELLAQISKKNMRSLSAQALYYILLGMAKEKERETK